MRRIAFLSLLVTLIGSFMLLFAPPVYAVDLIKDVCNNPNQASKPAICGDNASNNGDLQNPIFGPDGVITLAVQIIALLTGITAVIVFIISGIRMIVSAGDSKAFASARQAIIYATVGIVVAVGAQAIVSYVLSRIQ